MTNIVSRGFTKIQSMFGGIAECYFKKNIDKIFSYNVFLNSTKKELIEILSECVKKHPIKFHLKLEATYHKPHVEYSHENRAFKTSAREVFLDTDIDTLIEESFDRLLFEEESYLGKGSGFSLSCIDGLLLWVCEYSPLG
jgi:hypothetical protein